MNTKTYVLHNDSEKLLATTAPLASTTQDISYVECPRWDKDNVFKELAKRRIKKRYRIPGRC